MTLPDIKKKISKSSRKSTSNKIHNKPYSSQHISKDEYSGYVVQVLDFEFLSVDTMYFEEKDNQYGNTNFFYQGFEYKEKPGSVYERTPHKMEVEMV
ncbi:MAG: hypothetical protein ACPGRV_03080, partial [Candidatus Thalassarchaeaceae archaeon]